ncbi:MAG: CocE/NonD family hydrolase [bacterium]|nr:CocE/NonD family hydrolase [bacterium]
MRKQRFVAVWLFLTLGFAASLVAPAQNDKSWQKGWEEMVRARDGAELATNIFLPAGEGPFPVILTRTPYCKDGRNQYEADRTKKIDPKPAGMLGADLLLENGYACVIQDCRGRYRSQGEFRGFMDDPGDGYDTVEWVAAQPWCDGKVAMNGGSASAITSNMAALAGPPHLACIFEALGFGSPYEYMYFMGGEWRTDADKWLQALGITELQKEIRRHETYGDFWKPWDMKTYYRRIDVPIFQVGGWYDIFTQAQLDVFANLQKNGAGLAPGNQKLVMGPFAHGPMNVDFVYPNRLRLEDLMGATQVRWFDYWLKGKDDGIMNEAPIQYYVMGDPCDSQAPGNQWRTAPDWPPPSKATSWYLQAEGGLSTDQPTAAGASQTYAFDPADPVPTVGGNNLAFEKGPMDQRAVGERADVLKFRSAPLKHAIEVVGKMDMEMWAGSDAPDTDWVVKVVDVYPDGYEALVMDMPLRARFRGGFDREVFMTPGEVYKFKIDLWSTALVFNKGHRIAVHVTSSNAPRFGINPNNGEPLAAGGEPRVARNTIYFDQDHPSRLILPVTKVYGEADALAAMSTPPGS